MKKTMFITSVVMVIVMAIALTTSSLAWFTATGSAYVTTTALTVQAKANTSTGILISATDAVSAFGTNVALDGRAGIGGSSLQTGSVTGTDSSSNGMMPLVPLTNTNTLTPLDSDEDWYDAALVGLGAAIGDASFIGSKIDTTTFAATDGASTNTPYTNGFFLDQVWLANSASGSGANAISVDPSCTFYVAADGSDYTYTSGDPVLYVAVLGYNTTDSAFEIVDIFNSGDSLTTVNLGKTAAEFAAGEPVVSSCYSRSIASLQVNSGKTSFNLAPAAAGDAFGTAVMFKIVAWYDASYLNNNNSGFQLKFALRFDAATANS